MNRMLAGIATGFVLGALLLSFPPTLSAQAPAPPPEKKEDGGEEKPPGKSPEGKEAEGKPAGKEGPKTPAGKESPKAPGGEKAAPPPSKKSEGPTELPPPKPIGPTVTGVQNPRVVGVLGREDHNDYCRTGPGRTCLRRALPDL